MERIFIFSSRAPSGGPILPDQHPPHSSQLPPPLRRAALASHRRAIYQRNPSLCTLGGRVRCCPSSALRPYYSALSPPLPPPSHPGALLPSCTSATLCLHPPLRLARDLPRTPTDRQTAVWPSGCPATRRCLPAGIDARGCIQPASQPACQPVSSNQPAAISSRIAVAQIPRSLDPSEK